MKNSFPVGLSFALLLLVTSVEGENAVNTPALLPLTDNVSAPFMGIYEGPLDVGTKGNDTYAKWLNRTNVWGHDTIPFSGGSTWDHISGKWEDWFFGPWSKWQQGAPNRRMVFSIPVLPGPPDGSGPTTGTDAGKRVSLAEGATGAYNAYFKGLAETLVSHQLGNSILRLGWEWNGNWYAWKVVTAEDAHNFAAYWRQIVDTIRSVPGTENLKFDWNVTSGFKTSYDAAEAYPGDAYVDYVGIDVYDQTWVTTATYPQGIYPLPPGATPDEIEMRHETAWKEASLPASNLGVDYWQKFADAHKKPLTIPEWGLIQRPPPNDRGGLDDPYFIQQMYQYIQDPTHHVYFSSYFDCNPGAEGNSGISGIDGKPTLFPKSAELYRKLFSLPSSPAKPPTDAKATVKKT